MTRRTCHQTPTPGRRPRHEHQQRFGAERVGDDAGTTTRPVQIIDLPTTDIQLDDNEKESGGQDAYEDPVDDEADDLDDEERWLCVNAGSRDGWLDMDEFIDTVPDHALADRLQRAIHGRGAFRAVLDDHPGELTRFNRFSDERQRGRARQWLAGHGLRAAR